MARNATSLNQIANNLLNTLRGGRSSNTEHISLEQLKYNIKYYRALFIRRDMWRNNNRYRPFEQDLGVVDLETVDTADDPNVNSGVNVKRTTQIIPSPVRMKQWEGITHVSDPDKFGEQIPVIDAARTPWESYGKYSSQAVFANYINGYIYLFNDITASKINIRGVFEDPEQVHKFTRENGFDLYDEDSPFPISIDMIEGITKGIINGELKLLATTESDDETNTLQE